MFQNAVKVKTLGCGEIIKFTEFTSNELKDKIMKILEDPSYTRNMRELSRSFRDQKEKPLDRAVWWIEWAMRNPNSRIMKSPVKEVGYIVANSYDVVVAITIAFIVSIATFYKLFTLATFLAAKCNSNTSASRTKKIE